MKYTCTRTSAQKHSLLHVRMKRNG